MVKGPKLTARDSVAGESAIVNGPVPSITLNVPVAMTNPSHWSPEENWLILTSTLLPSESYRCPTDGPAVGIVRAAAVRPDDDVNAIRQAGDLAVAPGGAAAGHRDWLLVYPFPGSCLTRLSALHNR